MTREMNKTDWQEKESKLAYAAYKDEEHDCALCAEAPKLCPYCEGYNPSNSRELDEDWRPFIESVNQRFEQCGKQ